MHAAGDLGILGILLKAGDQQVPVLCMLQESIAQSSAMHAAGEFEVPGILLKAGEQQNPVVCKLQEALCSLCRLQCMLQEVLKSLGYCSRQGSNKSLSFACCKGHYACQQEKLKSLGYCMKQENNRSLYFCMLQEHCTVYHLQYMLQEMLKSLGYCTRQGSNKSRHMHGAGTGVTLAVIVSSSTLRPGSREWYYQHNCRSSHHDL